MTLPNFERSQIVIPAQGMGDVRDVLTDILRDFGEEDSGSWYLAYIVIYIHFLRRAVEATNAFRCDFCSI